MSHNPYANLRGLLQGDRLQVGSVLSVDDGQAVIELLDGARLTARGSASVGQNVYVKGGVIEGLAPDLPSYNIEV